MIKILYNNYIGLLKARQFKINSSFNLSMKSNHICFILDCNNIVNRAPDDFDNLYCKMHKHLDNTDLLEWINQDDR